MRGGEQLCKGTDHSSSDHRNGVIEPRIEGRRLEVVEWGWHRLDWAKIRLVLYVFFSVGFGFGFGLRVLDWVGVLVAWLLSEFIG